MPKKNRPAVVLPLDGSAISTTAYGAATSMAEILGAALHVVHVSGTKLGDAELADHLMLDAGQVQGVTLKLLEGNVVDAVLEYALNVDAHLIVMSGHGETYNQRHLAGSTALALMERATIPILVIRSGMQRHPEPGWRPARMLVPLDGSPEATSAMDQVFHLARDLHADVDVLHIAVLGKEAPKGQGAYSSPRYLDYPHYDWPAWSDEFIRRCYIPHREEVKLRLFHREGRPANVTLGFAQEEDADLIALSWHGYMQKKLASTVKGILRRTELPVLLIRTE